MLYYDERMLNTSFTNLIIYYLKIILTLQPKLNMSGICSPEEKKEKKEKKEKIEIN